MRFFIRFLALTLLFLLTFSAFAYFFWYRPRFKIPAHHAFVYVNSMAESARLKSRADTIRKFAAAHDYNTGLCFFADMSLSSGKSRFFIYT